MTPTAKKWRVMTWWQQGGKVTAPYRAFNVHGVYNNVSFSETFSLFSFLVLPLLQKQNIFLLVLFQISPPPQTKYFLASLYRFPFLCWPMVSFFKYFLPFPSPYFPFSTNKIISFSKYFPAFPSSFFFSFADQIFPSANIFLLFLLFFSRLETKFL